MKKTKRDRNIQDNLQFINHQLNMSYRKQKPLKKVMMIRLKVKMSQV